MLLGSELTTETSVRIKDRLLFPRFHRRQVLEPSLRGAEPILVNWAQLIALTRSADPQNYVGEIAGRRRVDGCATVGAECLLASVSALANLDIDFRLTR